MTLRPSEQPSHLDEIAGNTVGAPASPVPHSHAGPVAPSHGGGHAPPASQGLWLDFFERMLRR